MKKLEDDIPSRSQTPILNQIPNFSKELALSSYEPQFCFKVVEHLKKGLSLTSFSASIGVSPRIVNKWIERFEDFAYAVEMAEAYSQGEWEQIALDQARGDNKGNGVTLQFMMKNRFGDNYKDKQEIEHRGGMTIMVDTGFSTIEAEVIRDAEVIENDPDNDTDLL